MYELKRVFCSKRLWLCVLLVFGLNLCLYLREQKNQNYGFAEADVNLSELKLEYDKLLETYRGADVSDAIAEVTEFENADQLYDNIQAILTAREVMLGTEEGQEAWGTNFAEQYNSYLEQYPELVAAIQNGMTWDAEKLRIQSTAANKLLQQLVYLDSYDDYLLQIQENREKLSSFSIFNQEGSFSKNNIEKTADEFAALGELSLELGSDDAVTALFSFRLTDYLLIIILTTVALSFLDERQQGLWQMIHATPWGRKKLAAIRILILAITAVGATVLLYGSNLISGLCLYGGMSDFGRSIQSISMFQTIPLKLSVGQYIAQYLFFRAATSFVIALGVLLFLSNSNTGVKPTIAALTLLLCIEYVFYTFLPDQSIWNILKYFNVFCYIDLSNIFIKYLNLNVFGQAVGIRDLALWAILPVSIILGACCVVAQAHVRPAKEHGIINAVSCGLNRLVSFLGQSMNLLGYEAYKLFFMQGGVVIMAVFVALIVNSSFSVPITSTQVDYYMLQFQGEITKSTWDGIAAEREKLEDGITELKTAAEHYQTGEMDVSEYYQVLTQHNNDTAKLAELEQTAEIISSLESRGNDLGVRLSVLYEVPFQQIYGDCAMKNRVEWNLLVVFAMALLLSGIMTMEQTTAGQQQLLRATPKGRTALMARKYIILGLVVVSLWGISSARELHAFLIGVDTELLSVPIQSLTFLTRFPLQISIAGFLGIIYLGRLLILLCVGAGIMFFSSLFHRTEGSYLSVCLLLVVPTALWIYLDIDFMQWTSIARITDFVGLFTNMNGDVVLASACMGLMPIMACICMTCMVRRWNRPR